MDETVVRISTYGIFVRFRKSRLALRKGITSLPVAMEIAAQLRADRLHGQRDLFIVKYPEGTIVELPPPEGSAPMESPQPPESVEPGEPLPVASVQGLAPDTTRSAAPVPPDPPPSAPQVADSARPSAPPQSGVRGERMQRAIARSRAARESFERIVPTSTEGADDVDAELAEIHERLTTLHAATCRVAETFEAIATTRDKRTGT